MKTTITKDILIATLLVINFTSYSFAEAALPISTQVTEDGKEKEATEKKEDTIEIVPEIKIEAQASTTPSDPKLKTGTACSDEKLEEVQGELFTEIPMAKTIPCDQVDCKDLAPAKLLKDNYVKLKTAKTISCGK